ncbi:hypothetical protein CRG98_012571 [Punica granatum]|uniref:Uncharacterized protein n=1 Tax=Punica granatum TaxID=22663 RepID=A0A2I0KFS3_PUNGR|nr:hypothetical protein CRG98_012571 [Punica granatum]
MEKTIFSELQRMGDKDPHYIELVRILNRVMKASIDALVLMIGVLLEGLYALQDKTDSTSAIEWTPKEKYLDVLRHGWVNQCKDYIMVGKSSKSLVKRYVILDEAALTKRYERSDRRQHSLWSSSQTRDRLRKQSKPLKKCGLGELVVLENVEVATKSTCLMVGESFAKIPTNPDASDKSEGGLDLSDRSQCGPEYALVEARMHMAWDCPPSRGCVTDTHEKESPLLVYDLKVEGQ